MIRNDSNPVFTVVGNDDADEEREANHAADEHVDVYENGRPLERCIGISLGDGISITGVFGSKS
jgi:hypothetical protein